MSIELTVARTFNASLQRMWAAWTDPRELAKWWGPNGASVPTCEFDARPGGAISMVVRADRPLGDFAGSERSMRGTVKEAVRPDPDTSAAARLVFEVAVMRDLAKLFDILTTVTLEGGGGKTRMTLRITVTRSALGADRRADPFADCWTRSIDKLAELVERSGEDGTEGARIP